MQLYQRVQFIAEKLSGSQANLARHLNVHERTFQNYLNEKREDNLWPLLGPIWRLYPQVRREWLWWGEGEAFEEQPAGHAVPSGIDELVTLRAEAKELKAELMRAYQDNTRLSRELVAMSEERRKLAERLEQSEVDGSAERDNPGHAASA